MKTALMVAIIVTALVVSLVVLFVSESQAADQGGRFPAGPGQARMNQAAEAS